MRKISTLSLVTLCSAAFALTTARAAQLTWDPLGNGGSPSANGNWDTTAGNAVWYNGTSDLVWNQTSGTAPLNGAIFGGGDGTWAVTNDAVQVAVTNLNINNSGYTFWGPNAIYLGANDLATVAAGKSVTFNCNLAGSGTSPCWVLGSGSTMNVAGNFTSGQQVRLAGAANSAFNLTGSGNAPAIMFILAPVNVSAGSLIPSASFYIGYTQTLPAPNSTTYSAGTLTISGSSTVFTVNGNILIIGRATGTGTLNINDGTSTVGNTTANRNLAINYDSSASSSGTVNVNGGVLNVGSASQLGNRINFFQTAGTGPATATLTQTGGQINTWGGVQFGPSSGTTLSGSANWVQSGGSIYVGGSGITTASTFTAGNSDSFSIFLTGGTVGALASWSSSLPMTLGTSNGNITVQCSDGSNPFNISLSGPLTGTGGLNVSGGGTLTLSGANNFAGTTVVSNGTLVVTTGAAPTNGPVTVDGAAGSPTMSVQPNPGQRWTMGALTFRNGTPGAAFQFGSLAPSTAVAPILVGGNVAFTTTPTVTIGGTAIPVGTYPLIKYTGSVSGSAPTTANVPGYISAAYVTNIAATKTIALVVTGSSYNPALYWRVGSGVWDINTTANWTQFGSSAKYTDGNAVIFDDSASGPSPINVTLNTVVNPLSVTADNLTNKYSIAGSGNISGSGTLSVLGGGTLSLGGTNGYSGGTIVSAGQLNINNGGDPVNGTAIGTGILTLNAGAVLDNTSGSNVTLQASIPETWNGNFTYLGSANSLNTGSGLITMNSSITVSNGGNNLILGGTLADFGNNYQLSKKGNGTLTLAVANSFAGGLTVYSGQLNLGNQSAATSGSLTIYGGAIDNSSGADMMLNPAPASYTWAGSFSFMGSANMDLSGPNVVIPNGLGSITLNIVSNTLTTGGYVQNNNTTVYKTGAGTWEMTGPGSGPQSLGLVVSAGQVNLHKNSGQAIQGGNNVGLTVQSGGLVLDEANYQIHSDSPVPLPVVLSGGVWDLNGFNENVDQLSISSGGTLRNGAATSTSTITTISGYTAMLSGPNCQFDVSASDGNLNFNGALGGNGSVVKIGAGVLNLNSNNTYTGNTTVNAGTLALAFPSLASGSTVAIATNAMLQLNFAATNTIGALLLNGVSQPLGIYNAANTPAYLAGTGSLQVAIPSQPTNITYSVSGNSLVLSWPSNYVGWILQSNAVKLTVSSNWHDVPGSQTNSQFTAPLTIPGISNNYFRLRYP